MLIPEHKNMGISNSKLETKRAHTKIGQGHINWGGAKIYKYQHAWSTHFMNEALLEVTVTLDNPEQSWQVQVHTWLDQSLCVYCVLCLQHLSAGTNAIDSTSKILNSCMDARHQMDTSKENHKSSQHCCRLELSHARMLGADGCREGPMHGNRSIVCLATARARALP